ncbi:MAG: tRNA (adenosine(37)-N6)-dimethylallyltransferase MiaA [Acidobacteria bacterium]|nr:tRNA (adenosine(37)-N6)-dimethylallyltransferase MiaA [Acidobacteriota bacterium]MBS1865132.1 tRNA (adenosine(37)-N6)-dimethylallyltransferase MiaA [Acidobacteriota bacterium]
MKPAVSDSPLVVIVGPTASGKSALGVALAKQFGGEIVACDSTQLYRGFDIGTAKPSLAEREGIAHHLLDVLNPDEPSTAGGYRELAEAVLGDLKSRGKLPIFTVGTGLYLRALLEGLADLPQRSEEIRERLRESVAAHDPGHLHATLKRLDPDTAAKIAPEDEQKIIRAIEVCLLTSKPISEVHRTARKPLLGWVPIKIGLQPPREKLIERVHFRTDKMLANGWIEEVQSLLSQNFPEDAKPFDFIGYRELRDVLRNKMKLEDARGAIQQSTRQYAKRQLTWFRRETGVHWLAGFGDQPEIQQAAAGYLGICGLPRGQHPASV